MVRRKTPLLLAVIVACLLGCSRLSSPLPVDGGIDTVSASDGPLRDHPVDLGIDPTDAAVPETALAAYCEVFATFVCGHIDRCCPSASDWKVIGLFNCPRDRFVTKCLSEDFSPTVAAHVHYDPSRFLQCRAAIEQSIFCDTPNETEQRKIFGITFQQATACQEMLKGQQGVDGECEADLECQPGLICEKTVSSDPNDKSVCYKPPALGESCVGKECSFPLACVFGVCKPRSGDGEPCYEDSGGECQQGLYCNLEANQCKPLLPASAECYSVHTSTDPCRGMCDPKAKVCVKVCGSS